MNKELEELRLYKEEHERLKGELNEILHPEGGGPKSPSFCDLVAYVRGDLKQLRDQVKKLGTEKFENALTAKTVEEGNMIVISCPPVFLSQAVLEQASNIKRQAPKGTQVLVLPDYMTIDVLNDEQLDELGLQRK